MADEKMTGFLHQQHSLPPRQKIPICRALESAIRRRLAPVSIWDRGDNRFLSCLLLPPFGPAFLHRLANSPSSGC